MIDHIYYLNYKFFILLNHVIANDFLDYLCPLLRNKFLWSPLYLFIITFLIINQKRQGLLFVFLMFILAALSDTISSHILKPYFEILRPCQDPDMEGITRLLVNCPHGYGMPSSHASNHFALAFYFIFLYPKSFKWLFPIAITWASIISLSQVYVGVHYPIDIFIGMLIGFVTGLIMAVFAKFLVKEYPDYFIHQMKHPL